MKNKGSMRESLFAKVLAFFLIVIIIFAVAISVFDVAAMFWLNAYEADSFAEVRTELKYQVGYLDDDHFETALHWTEIGYKLRYVCAVSCVVGVIAFFALVVFLYCAAGHRPGIEGVSPGILEKVPFDVLTVIVFFIALGVGYFCDWITNQFYWYDVGDIIPIIGLLLVGIFSFLIFMGYTMSLATRLKLGGLISGTLIYKILRFVFRVVKRLFLAIVYVVRRLPIVWKACIICIVLALAQLFIYTSYWEFFPVWCLQCIVLIPLAILMALSLRRLQRGARMIAAGDIDYKVDTKHLFWDFRRHAEDLNSINSAISKAVDERMRSERFKTELITNVSHDIKTPLTSIINYVDLIKKEPAGSEKIGEYVEVLDRQSLKLKKLIEDLVEASKASTGNIGIHLMPSNIGVMISQVVGEYESRMAACDLTLVVNIPEEPVVIMADGKHLWRVFDNLLNNATKYAMPGTRVYLTLEAIGDKAVVVLRNISKTELNISADELMERFVRGDSSRNTEGHGLGLNIARSLTELQRGSMNIHIDGDLFKVVLSFERL